MQENVQIGCTGYVHIAAVWMMETVDGTDSLGPDDGTVMSIAVFSLYVTLVYLLFIQYKIYSIFFVY